MPSFIAKDGTRIHYESYGSGRPLILVHGWGIARVWRYQIAEFSPFLRVITMDLRGHGESEGPGVDYSFDTLVDDLLALIRELGLDGATLIGWSMGASVAIKLMAERRPREVSSLVIVAGTPMFTADYEKREGRTGIPRRKGLSKTILSVMKRYVEASFARKAFVRNRLWIVLNCGPWASLRTLFGYMKEMAGIDLTVPLSGIEVPSLILHGDADILCPVEGAYLMAERIKGSRLEILHGADHSLCLTDAERVNAKIWEFIREGS